jgi:hypothetical protein
MQPEKLTDPASITLGNIANRIRPDGITYEQAWYQDFVKMRKLQNPTVRFPLPAEELANSRSRLEHVFNEELRALDPGSPTYPFRNEDVELSPYSFSTEAELAQLYKEKGGPGVRSALMHNLRGL